MFHMKHPQGECSVHTCMGIAEPQDVGLWRSQRPNMRLRVSQNMLAYFMTKYEHVGHEVSKHFFISEGYNQQQICSSSRRAWLRRPQPIKARPYLYGHG